MYKDCSIQRTIVTRRWFSLTSLFNRDRHAWEITLPLGCVIFIEIKPVSGFWSSSANANNNNNAWGVNFNNGNDNNNNRNNNNHVRLVRGSA